MLKDWCHEAAFNVIAAAVKQRAEPGVTVDCRILEVRDTDVSTHTHTTHTACRQCSNPPHSGVDCDGKAYGSWACAGAQFSGTAVDTKDQAWRGIPGQLLTTQFIQYTVPSSLTW